VSVRLSVIVARESRIAVVLRRGPTKHVLLVRWDLTDDSFEAGQWLNGRIYERRCDLSPSGDRFLYFAATYRPPLRTWTAVSRPPYFTALALWPKGDAWGGGGLFDSEDHVLLNHPPSAMDLHHDTRLPPGVTVTATANAGRGEDDPIFGERMERDGWTLDEEGQWGAYSGTTPFAWKAEIPEVWSRPHPQRGSSVRLRMCTVGVGERQGSWYVQQYDVIGPSGKVHLDLGRVDWADWDHDGDLIFADNGCLRRIPCRADGVLDAAARTLIDLSAPTFIRRKAVAEAKQWRGDRPRGVRL
jgi:hypothetical protein